MNPFQSESSLLREEERYSRERQEVIDRMSRRYIGEERGVNAEMGSGLREEEMGEAVEQREGRMAFQAEALLGSQQLHQWRNQPDRQKSIKLPRTIGKTQGNFKTEPDQIYPPDYRTKQNIFFPEKQVTLQLNVEEEIEQSMQKPTREKGRIPIKRDKEAQEKIKRAQGMREEQKQRWREQEQRRREEEQERREVVRLAHRLDAFERRDTVVGKKQIKLKIEVSQLPVCKYERNNEQCTSALRESCVICTLNYSQGERVIRMPCFHFFHQDCCKEWLQIKPSCPTCNYQL